MLDPPRRPVGRWALASALGALAALLPGPALAQMDVDSLAAACSLASPRAVCVERALAAQSAHAHVGLLAAGGVEVPGASSTLGRRFGGTPRFSGSFRATALRGDLPAPGSAPESTPWRGRGFNAYAFQGALALGVFDGFSPIPTVGGIFSLDLVGSFGAVFLPDGSGFQDDPRYAGLGARLGILRESFTLPGITLSASRRWVGHLELLVQPGVPLRVDPVVTSLRGVVGKDLLALGMLAGVGWDRYESEGELHHPGPCVATCPVTRFQDLRSEQVLFFGGASLNLLLLQLSAEGGWARGLDGPAERAGGGYDPGGGTPYLALAARLTL